MKKDVQGSTWYWAAEYACWRSGGLRQRGYCQGRGYRLYRFKNGISAGKKLGLISNVRDEEGSKFVAIKVKAAEENPKAAYWALSRNERIRHKNSKR